MPIQHPHEVDVIVGRNVRILRTQKGISQTELADAIGITFQQVQKYEKGSNRISASRLHQIAEFLGIGIATLFLGTDNEGNVESIVPFSSDAIAFARIYDSIQSPKVKQAVRGFLQAVADKDHMAGKAAASKAS
ncbi:helix-turn-helix domain-containing protein [Rhizobium sp. PAMB 3174]